ncbi:MAG: hypothetical protein NC038_04935 [Paludibacter sp.]|nr:hypothetical protein [Bacteroidales bacterium]MCM1068347.1 hypothetical protein [Prevotella sp.]MCM1354025.1 hypothetical protein [Bacteroides sp.]MCM1442133.1 hypothetical protein [Muribaculum sp.]MCM1481974.1 hypothetical protein [Paludibacter sp.]
MNKLKLLGLALATLFTSNAMAADYTYALSEATKTDNVYEWSFAETKNKGKVAYVEVPANSEGTVQWTCKSANSARFIYLATVNNGTATATDRGGVMAKNWTSEAITYTTNDIFEENGTSYLAFTTTDDFKSIGIKLTANSAAPIETPFIKSYTIAGINATIDNELNTITAELPYGTDMAAALEAATVTLGGTATQYEYNADKTQITVSDGTATVTYTLNITVGAFKCGEIINATTQQTVTGTIGGKALTNITKNPAKLDKNKYFGIQLANGTFMTGDVFTISLTATPGTAAEMGTMKIYADQNGTELLYESENVGEVGENDYVLPATVNGKNALYIYRGEGNDWNPTFDYIKVTRACEASVASFIIAGVQATIDENEKTITAELPFGTKLTEEDWNNAYTLAGPATSATYNENHTTLTVDETVYTLNITIAEALSEDATLKTLSVNGTAITLEEGVYEYTLALPYGTTELPTVTAEANDMKATVAISEITATAQVVTITVNAAAGNTLTYTITLSVLTAPKNLLQLTMSNGYSAWQPAGEDVIYAYYMAGTERPSIVAESVVLCETATGYALNEEGTVITVTGEDQTTKEYQFVCEAVEPLTFTADQITFDGTQTWVVAPYGYNESKGGYVFSKTDTDYSREWNGKTHIDMFLPACDNIVLYGNGTGTERDIKLFVNGIELTDAKTTKTESEPIVLNQKIAFMLTIVSNQTKGDGGVAGIKLIKNVTPSGIENIAAELDLDAPMYNVLGQRVDAQYKGVVIQNGQKFLLQ